MSDFDEILDGLFHGCALAAYLDQAAAEGRWPPDSGATRRRAYGYYESALADKNRRKSAAIPHEASGAGTEDGG